MNREPTFLDRRFEQYDKDNPKVYKMFRELAFVAYMKDRQRIGAKLLMERLRWEFTIETNDPDFKINNNYTSRYVRKLVKERPLMASMFAFRELKS